MLGGGKAMSLYAKPLTLRIAGQGTHCLDHGVPPLGVFVRLPDCEQPGPRPRQRAPRQRPKVACGMRPLIKHSRSLQPGIPNPVTPMSTRRGLSITDISRPSPLAQSYEKVEPQSWSWQIKISRKLAELEFMI